MTCSDGGGVLPEQVDQLHAEPAEFVGVSPSARRRGRLLSTLDRDAGGVDHRRPFASEERKLQLGHGSISDRHHSGLPR
jgi:hypothetical protein